VSLAFSPTGQTLAVGYVGTSPSNYVGLWDVPSRRITGWFEQSGDKGCVVAFSPSGTQILSVGTSDVGNVSTSGARAAGGAHLLTISNGMMVKSVDLGFGGAQMLSGVSPYWPAVAFSPDGKLCAAAHWHGQITLWDLPTVTPHVITDPSFTQVRSIAFSPDGSTLAVAGDLNLTIWDMKRGVSTALTPPMSAKLLYHQGVAFSPDGATLAVVGGGGNTGLWRTGTWAFETAITDPLPESAQRDVTPGYIAFTKDGKSLIIGQATGDVEIIDLATRARTNSFTVPGGILSMALSPDGKTLATGQTHSASIQLRRLP
jgi:WD40 repeat protein